MVFHRKDFYYLADFAKSVCEDGDFNGLYEIFLYLIRYGWFVRDTDGGASFIIDERDLNVHDPEYREESDK